MVKRLSPRGFGLPITAAMLLLFAGRSVSRADPVPTLNDILNASQLDVRSSARLPKPADARVLPVQADAPLRQAFRTGPGVTRLASVAIWFSGWSPTWTPEKSLVMRLYAGQDFTRVHAEAEEPYSRRAWEGAVHVFTLNAPVAQNADYTFELTTRGGRSITGAALASPPYSPDAGPLERGGEALREPLWFETSVKRRSDLDLLYLDVFSHFDLHRPDMQAVRDAVAVRDWERARRALVAHFEERKDLFPAGAKRSPEPAAALRKTLADADLVVQHKYRAVDEIVDLGPRWNHLAVWRSRGGVGLTRSGLRGILASAYAQTHDEKYARAWDAMLRFQFEDLPSPLRAGVIRPDARNIAPTGEPGIGGGSMWASLSIAARLTHGFAYYRAFRASQSFSLDTRFAFIANLGEMSDLLERMKGGGNWEAQNTTALLEFATTFPEFLRSGDWQARGFAGALQSCLENTFPDGPLREASTNYHALSLGRYLGVLEGARRQPTPGLSVPAVVRDRVEKMCDYLLYSTMPGGQLPAWGDSNPPLDAASLLQRGADYYGRPDMRWAATGGRSGTRPRTTSAAFPEAGYYLMRSSWSPDAAFLALHNGHSSAHGHHDANSFVLSANGSELLIDPGVYIYGTPESQLLSGSISHNTVTMDDRDTVNDGGEARWSSGWWTDLYDGTNAGYEEARGEPGPARHRRIVLYLKPSLFFVVDAAAGDRPHDWTLRDHFAPGRLDMAADGKSITFRPTPDPAYPGKGRGGLRVWSALDDAAHLTAAPGIAAGGWERKIEAPVAIWSQFAASEAHWATLLEPFAGSPSAAGWDVRQDEHGNAMASQSIGQARRFLLARTESEAPMPPAWVDAAGFSTDAQAAAFEQGAAEKGGATPRRLSIRHGTLFLDTRSNSPAIVRADQPVTLLEAAWRGDTLTVHRVGGAGVALRTFGARRLVLNGKVIAVPAAQDMVRLPDSRGG
jgi:hypothetical protein